jgi:glycosyltransferase involved in cell wall biosynthesis
LSDEWPPASLQNGILLVMNELSEGGGDRVAVLLANGFARAGIPTRILLLRDAGRPEVKSLLDERVSLVGAGPPLGLKISAERDGLGHRHFERVRGIRFIRRQIDAFNPAVVLGATDNMAFITALSRRPQDKHIAFGFKLTNRLSRPNIGPLRRIYRYNLFKFIFERLDFVLTLTDAERAYVLTVHPGREDLLRTVPNPYVTDEMLADRQPRHPGPPRLVAVGRMVPQKRFDLLLRAFALTGRPDARLTILGDGPQRPRLERLAQSLGIADRVDMPGYVANVVAWLRRSDLMVLSSDYEGLPAVVMEALACNVPVVTTESFFAARDLLGRSASCAVVPIGDAQALAAAIDRCLQAERTEDLREIAEPYRVDSAVRAHIDALARAVAAQNRTETPV